MNMRILNELEHAENMLLHGFRNYVSFQELSILCKYYRYIGITEEGLEQKLIDFCIEKDPQFNENIHIGAILNCIRDSKKYVLRVPVDVPIRRNELDIIRSLKNYRHEKVLLSLLFLGKYYNLTNTKIDHAISNNYYVKDKDSLILQLAHTYEKKGENIFFNLVQKELIGWMKKDGGYFLKFTNALDDSPIEFMITDIKNIIRFYPDYCKKCGKAIEKKSNRQYLCEDCWKEKEKGIWRESKRKIRNVQV
jgi:hypothetical protein